MAFKVCVIGCGGMSTGYHGPSLARYAAEHPDVQLAGCCDLDEGKAARYREGFGFARHYTDLTLMLEREGPDSVALMAPVDLTCELSCRVLDLGYPLFMEKPPGMTTEQVDRMIAAAEKAGVPTRVAFNRRYMPLMRELRRRLAALQPGELQHARYDLTRVGRADPDFSTTAIHGIDAVRFIAGADYREVRFYYQPLPELGPTVANIFMDCTMTSGATTHLDFCPVSGVTVERATVYARDRTYFLNTPMVRGLDGQGRLLELHRGDVVADLTGAEVSDGPEDYAATGFYGEHASFLDALRAGQRPSGGLKEARQSVEVMECLRLRRAEYVSPE